MKSDTRGLRCLAILTVVLCISGNLLAYSGGTGEPNDPYQIATVSDWNDLMNTSSDWNTHFIMTADVNLQGVTLTPVGNSSTNFTGVFDGNEHIIRNADVNNPTDYYVGLFGVMSGPNSQIHNLGVEEVNIIGNEYLGGLVGHNISGSISNCYSTGAVTGEHSTFVYYIGGLVGLNEGTISNCYSSGAVTSGNSFGIGGLVGRNKGTISNCYSSGAVTGERYYIGGLVGWNEGAIDNCYSTGAVTSGDSFGIGGLVGENEGTIGNCYSTGAVSSGNSFGIGGLVGRRGYGSIITTSFWDITTSGRTISAGGKGLTDSQMKSVTPYQNAGWADKGWILNDGLDYPHLDWENTVGIPIPPPPPVLLTGSGTEQDPYQVQTAEDFALLNAYVLVLDKHIALMTDINLSGVVICPIGGDDLGAFTGIFEGNGHIIRNADINLPNSDYTGLFGYIGRNGQIRNLGIEDVKITGREFVGGLVGFNGGSINNCYSTGTVSGSSYVGGLVGDNDNGGTITACHTTGAVSGSNYVGGLVGGNIGSLEFPESPDEPHEPSPHSIIIDCYATGNVSGDSGVGGLVGRNDYDSNIIDCYATGTVSGRDAVGGLVGLNGSDMSEPEYGVYEITNCYAAGAVNGDGGVGGLVGVNYYFGIITACYATGAVNGSRVDWFGSYYWLGVGGLVGGNEGSINNCYSTGAVTGREGTEWDWGTGIIGGLVGENSGNISNCYSTGIVTVEDDSWVIGGFVGEKTMVPLLPVSGILKHPARQ